MWFGQLLLCLAALTSCLQAEEPLLKQVVLIFRHGERTPASTYKKDIYKNEDFFPYGWGHLTNAGKLQQYRQGQWLRQRYNSLLGEILTPTLVQASATYPPRAQMSLALMLAGLLPPRGPQVWNKDLAWQPFPWVNLGEQVDKLLLATKCPRVQEALDEVEKSKELKEYNEKHQELYKYLSEQTGENVRGPADVFDIFGTLKAEEDYGLHLPEWTKSVYPEKMAEVTARHFIVNTNTQELRRLTGGRLLKKILEIFKTKMVGNSDHPKLVAFAGHDSTVVNFLRALGVWDEQVPGYNIMTILELFSSGGQGDWTIKVLLKNSTDAEPHTLTLPGCQVQCPSQEFVRLTADVIPQDLETECKTNNQDYTPERPPSGP